MKTWKWGFAAVPGGCSLLTAFSVLAITVFSVLSVSSVCTDGKLVQKSAVCAAEYYDADCEAEKILALIREGKVPAEVKIQDDVYTYAIHVSDLKTLHVSVRVKDTSYEILQWQTVSVTEWDEDDSLNLWDGTT
jgi:hypothetical protein